jgi:hypothetical protein
MNGATATVAFEHELLGIAGQSPLVPQDTGTGSLARLRALMPRRPLGLREAEGVAERQAGRLRAELGVLAPRLTESDLDMLPWLIITRRELFPTSGLATKTDYGWVVVLRSSEAKVRQRFTLAHEIKHCLDDPFIEQLYPSTAGYGSPERTERVCDRFAAALLMPKCCCAPIGPMVFRTLLSWPGATTSRGRPCRFA